MLAGAMKFL